MPEQLKIIIDADVQKAIAGVQNLSKVITTDFVRATNSASAAAASLSSEVANSVKKINASLSGLKVTSLDIAINTSSIDESIKSIQAKFSALVDPELNILANTAQAEIKIKELVADLATLKGSEIFIRANDTQALRTINEVEAELKSLVGKEINLSVKADLSKLEELRAKLSSLKVTPVDVSVNTAGIDASIKSIQSKFAALIDPEINVLANTELAEVKIKELLSELSALKGSEIFIKANDVQALQKINEIEKELNSLVGKQINLNVTTDLTKLNELKAKLDSIKVSPINVSANTSSIDATIKGIQSKFAAIVDPEINVLANTEAAEVKIKELLSDLSSLKGSEIFIRANDTQALKVINEVEVELNSLLDKQIRLNVNTTDALARINILEKELISLEALKISPNISSTQLAVFESNIQRIKSELNSLKGGGVVIPIAVNTALAQANVNRLSETIETLRAKIEARKSFITVETDITKIAAYNKEIERLEARMRSIQNVGKKGFELFVVPGQTIQSVKNLSNSVAAFGGGVKSFIAPAVASFKQLPTAINPIIVSLKSLEKQAQTSGLATTGAFNKAFQSVKSLAAILPGIGLAGIFGVAISAITELTESLFKAEKAAIKHSDAIEGVADEYAGAIASVNSLRTNIQLAKEGFISKEGVVKQYNESIGKTTGLVKNLDEAEKELGKNAQAYIKFTLLKAAANFALEEASKKAVKAALIPIEDIKKNLSFFERLNLPFEKAPSRRVQEQKFLAPVIAGVEKEAEEFEKIAADFQKRAAQIAKDMGFSFFGDFKIDKTNISKSLDKAFDEIIARARQFTKEFGQSFVVPNLDDSFFKNKQELFNQSKKLLDDVRAFIGGDQTALQIKLPVQVTTETKLNQDDLKKFLRGLIPESDIRKVKVTVPIVTDFDIQIAESLAKEFEPTQALIDNFFKNVGFEIGVPITVIPDITIPLGEQKKALDTMIEGFARFGNTGIKELQRLAKEFPNLNQRIAEGTLILQTMQETVNVLNQAVGQGMVNAFNSVFDAILEGKSVIKALGNAVKALVVETIKAVAQMLILRAITTALFPASAGAGGGGGIKLPKGFFLLSANPSSGGFGGGGIGSRAFNNVLTVNVVGQVSGSTINLAGQRAANSSGRFG